MPPQILFNGDGDGDGDGDGGGDVHGDGDGGVTDEAWAGRCWCADDARGRR